MVFLDTFKRYLILTLKKYGIHLSSIFVIFIIILNVPCVRRVKDCGIINILVTFEPIQMKVTSNMLIEITQKGTQMHTIIYYKLNEVSYMGLR